MHCPVCRADNPSPPNCRRCKADLALLFTLEEQRTRALHTARAFLRHGDLARAEAFAAGAHALRHDSDSLQLLALVHLLRRDFDSAWECYRKSRVKSQEPRAQNEE